MRIRGVVKNNRSRSRKRLVPADNVGLKSKQWGLLTRNLVLAVQLVDPLSHHSYFAFEIPLWERITDLVSLICDDFPCQSISAVRTISELWNALILVERSAYNVATEGP